MSMQLLLTFAIVLPWAIGAATMLGYRDTGLSKEPRTLKKKSSKNDGNSCALESCVRNFREFEAALGKDRSSAEIYICAGATIKFDHILTVYSITTTTTQPPFDLKLLCCDCNCVLDAKDATGAEVFAIAFDNDNYIGPLSGMKLTMSGITLQNAPFWSDGFAFFFYLQEDSVYQEIGECSDTIDLSGMIHPFLGITL